jgi:hypothetical protein
MYVITVFRYLRISIGVTVDVPGMVNSPKGTVAPSAGEVMATSNSAGCSPFPEITDSINEFRKKFHQSNVITIISQH